MFRILTIQLCLDQFFTNTLVTICVYFYCVFTHNKDGLSACVRQNVLKSMGLYLPGDDLLLVYKLMNRTFLVIQD